MLSLDNEPILKVFIQMFKARYKGKSRLVRHEYQSWAWIAKEIMLEVIYPDRPNDANEPFADWMKIKPQVIQILKDQGEDEARAWVKNYVENVYLPPSPGE